MKRLSISLTAALALIVLCGGRADAACTISVTGVSFGSYDVFAAAPLDSTGTVTIECNKMLQVILTRGSSSSFTPRTMRSGALEILDYNLYLDAARTVIWGDGSSGTQLYSKSNSGNNAFSVTVYGRVPAGRDVSAGSYSDTVTVTMNF